jgi:hypothetical protein
MKPRDLCAALIAAALVAACFTTKTPPTGSTGPPDGSHLVVTSGPSAPCNGPSDTPVCYAGGQMIENVQVVPVFWGAPNSAVSNALPGFYSAFLSSSYMSWLSEYSTSAGVSFCPKVSTPGNQVPGGAASATAAVTMTPPPDGPVTWSKTFAQTDLVTLFGEVLANAPGFSTLAPGLPQPTANTLYVVYLPSTVTMTKDPGWVTCTNMEMSHTSFGAPGVTVGLAVVADCSGTSTSDVDQATIQTSRAVVAAVTDRDGPRQSPYAAWVNPNDPSPFGFCTEITDICQTNSPVKWQGYAIQPEWSNKNKECYVPCGAPGLPCCDQGAACESGTCNAANQCPECGKRGEACCVNLSCTDLTICVGGECVCGGDNQPCCVPNGTCNVGLCSNGECTKPNTACGKCASKLSTCEAGCTKAATKASCQNTCQSENCSCIKAAGTCGPHQCIVGPLGPGPH